MNEREEKIGSDVEIRSPIVAKLDNFWYHYKWHTIAALFLILVVVICSLQMCSKTEVDFHVMYAGGDSMSRSSVDGDVPPYVSVTEVFKQYVDDVDGDGSKNIAFSTYYAPTEAEMRALEAEGIEVPYSLISSDADALSARFGMGDYYLCFLSPEVYERYKGISGTSAFALAQNYAPEDGSVEFYNEYAVKLSSTGFYQNNPAIKANMAEDTLVALQIKRVVGVGKDNDEKYAVAEDVFRQILAE